MILIISQPSDTHADVVRDKLRARGAEVVVFDHAEFPRDAEISIAYAGGRCRRTIRTAAREIPLDEVTAAWHRRPRSPRLDERVLDAQSRSYVAAESKELLIDLWNSLQCLRVPAPQPVYRRAEHKASQLVHASELGFELPPTLITNSPGDFLEFYRAHGGKVISKLPSAVFHKEIFGDDFMRFTELVSHRDVGYARSVRYSPMIFQAYVEKRFELRVTVVGERIFAAEIHSQATNHTRHDWRKYDHASTPHRAHELPPSIADRCFALVRRLGLCYGTIDLVLTPDGRYVFLEINPNGQYLWIEQLTGMPISDAICDLLMSGHAGVRQ
jgi:glutathione synthase/RimK-type ligase-like ATP-grasp enzyme